MTDDFYCDEVLSGRTSVTIVRQSERVLAFHHTRPFWPVHIVVIPRFHVPSLTDLGDADPSILGELLEVVREVAAEVTAEHGACRVLTNLGAYQDSKHLHFHINSGTPLINSGATLGEA
ncbi:MAG: HIT domain-containing protein [Planctomycetota bacterium]|jgi:histidine triad (HIT) family protein|nr:HIT domain-containing protein [Planctomycetota bacterium]